MAQLLEHLVHLASLEQYPLVSYNATMHPYFLPLSTLSCIAPSSPRPCGPCPTPLPAQLHVWDQVSRSVAAALQTLSVQLVLKRAN